MPDVILIHQDKSSYYDIVNTVQLLTPYLNGQLTSTHFKVTSSAYLKRYVHLILSKEYIWFLKLFKVIYLIEINQTPHTRDALHLFIPCY